MSNKEINVLENKICEYYNQCKENTKFHCTHLNQLHDSQAHCTIRAILPNSTIVSVILVSTKKYFPRFIGVKLSAMLSYTTKTRPNALILQKSEV